MLLVRHENGPLCKCQVCKRWFYLSVWKESILKTEDFENDKVLNWLFSTAGAWRFQISQAFNI